MRLYARTKLLDTRSRFVQLVCYRPDDSVRTLVRQQRSPTSYGVSSLATATLILDNHLSPSSSNWQLVPGPASPPKAGLRSRGATPSKLASIYTARTTNYISRVATIWMQGGSGFYFYTWWAQLALSEKQEGTFC